ncbi:hypothetical protein SH611_05015 [Geminicoccaceae bacterium 1502E]|nr:hypothetical protein [Geminicoccaceae bacterium 1502E]
MEAPAFWIEWIKVAAFASGIVVGSVALFSPAWVWYRQHLINGPAVVLAGFGCVMITASIWRTVQIEGPGFKAYLAEVHKEIKETKTDLAATIQKNKEDTLSTVKNSYDELQNFLGAWNINREMFPRPKVGEIRDLEGIRTDGGDDGEVEERLSDEEIDDIEGALKALGYPNSKVQHLINKLH